MRVYLHCQFDGVLYLEGTFPGMPVKARPEKVSGDGKPYSECVYHTTGWLGSQTEQKGKASRELEDQYPSLSAC